MRRQAVLVTIAVLSLFTSPLHAQRRAKPKLNDDVPLPADFSLDYQLGIAERTKIRGNTTLLENTPYNQVGSDVFSKLVGGSQISSLGLPYMWNFTIPNDQLINAHSLPDGEIAVDSGLAQLIGTNPGLWAAVLSHEITHTARRHAVRQYLYNLYIAQQVAYYEVTGPSFCTSSSERVYITAIGCEIEFGGARELQAAGAGGL